MTAFKFGRFLLPAACALALAPASAMAQTTGVAAASQSGNSAVSNKAAAATAAPAPTAGAGASAPASGGPALHTGKSARLPAGEEFKSVDAAKAHCPGDTVVWSTLSKSKSYHNATSKYYGKTKHGAYVCEKDATAAGFHPAKT